MKEKDIIIQIANQITGIEVHDLTKAEKNIAKVLVTNGYIKLIKTPSLYFEGTTEQYYEVKTT